MVLSLRIDFSLIEHNLTTISTSTSPLAKIHSPSNFLQNEAGLQEIAVAKQGTVIQGKSRHIQAG